MYCVPPMQKMMSTLRLEIEAFQVQSVVGCDTVTDSLPHPTPRTSLTSHVRLSFSLTTLWDHNSGSFSPFVLKYLQQKISETSNISVNKMNRDITRQLFLGQSCYSKMLIVTVWKVSLKNFQNIVFKLLFQFSSEQNTFSSK